MAIISKVLLTIPIPTIPVTRIVDKWVSKLQQEGPAIYQKILARIPDLTTFQNRLAGPSSTGYQTVINPDFVSRSGLSRDRITANQLANLRRSFDKYAKKLQHVFETVDTVEAARFKELVELMRDDFAAGVSERTLPFTGTKIEGRSCAPIAALWMVKDPKVFDLIRGGDDVQFGGPIRVPRLSGVPAFKAGVEGRLVQAGATIVKANYAPGAFSEENDRTNELVDGFVDPALLLVPFATGAESHVNYILGAGDEFLLEVQVGVAP